MFLHSISRLLGVQIFGSHVYRETTWSGTALPSFLSPFLFVTADSWLDGVEGAGTMYVVRNWSGIFGTRLKGIQCVMRLTPSSSSPPSIYLMLHLGNSRDTFS